MLEAICGSRPRRAVHIGMSSPLMEMCCPTKVPNVIVEYYAEQLAKTRSIPRKRLKGWQIR
jgi:hypothetical protein